jgi:hypothetical protein
MGTNFSVSCRTDATLISNLRVWAQFVEDTLVNGGWVVTADTGQTLPSALVGTSTNYTRRGFRIYRMNDILQAVSPIFMKLSYGGGFGNSPFNGAGLWPEIGHGTDGAGNITGQLWDGRCTNPAIITPDMPPVSSNNGSNDGSIVGGFNSYGAAGPGWFTLGMFIKLGSSSSFSMFPMVFTMERTKDNVGNDTSDGVLMLFSEVLSGGGSQSVVSTAKYLKCHPTTIQPGTETGPGYALTTRNPSENVNGTIGVGVPFHFRGLAQQPGINMVIVNSLDVAPESQLMVTIYGYSHLYQQLRWVGMQKAYTNPAASYGAGLRDLSAMACIRYE